MKPIKLLSDKEREDVLDYALEMAEQVIRSQQLTEQNRVAEEYIDRLESLLAKKVEEATRIAQTSTELAGLEQRILGLPDVLSYPLEHNNELMDILVELLDLIKAK